MKRLSTGVLAALVAVSCGLSATAASPGAPSPGNAGKAVIAQSSAEAPAANLGTPPSGQVPILFNDRHVYAKPDTLKQGRVLAALVKGGTVLIPLRSMFEQMGATVSYDAATKTVTVSKPGSEISVTVGKPEVSINRVSRPLDVPPMIYQGSVLVPIRVISEGLGAFVQWVPDKQLVVVRYVVATPPPEPTAPPVVPSPTLAPTPLPVPTATPFKDRFIAGDYIISPKIYNEFSPGNTGTSSFAIRGAYEFDLFNLPWMLEGNFEQYGYPHNCTTFAGAASTSDCFVNVIGNTSSTPVGAFTARDNDLDARFGLKIADPRIYIGIGYIWRNNNYGYPRETSFGYGAEKLPDLNQLLSVYGSVYYYPNAKGAYNGLNLAYNILKYNLGLNYVLGNSPVFLDLGWMGMDGSNKANAPSTTTANGPYAGIGIKF